VFLSTLPTPVSDAAAAGDLTLRTRIRVSTQGEPSEITQYWTANRFVEDAKNTRTLVDLEAGTVTLMHKKAKTYSTLTYDEFRRLGAKAADQLAMTRSKLASMSPPLRQRVPAMVRAMTSLGESGPYGPRWSVKPTGKQERIAGYTADEFTVTAGTVEGSAWATRELRPPFSREKILAFRAAAAGPPRFGLNPLDLIDVMDAVLLRTRATLPDPDGITVTMEVVEARQQAPPAEMLSIPSEFRRAVPDAQSSDAGSTSAAPDVAAAAPH
jgi:hypothetical protein